MPRKTYNELRSSQWFADPGKAGFIHRERIAQAGYSKEDYEGRPAIGVFSTWSELNPCHIHFRERAEDVKRGIWAAGGFPLEVPCMSLGEPYMKPTTMLYRDLLAMEVEENLRAHPLDGVVLMGGCDKTTPAMLMGALAMDLPTIFVPSGPMLTGRWRGHTLGSGTDASRWYDELKAGNITEAQYKEMETAGARSAGHCQTMGTASTMTSLAETMGFTLPGAASIPAPDSRHRHMASACGRRVVDLVWEDLKPSDFITPASFRNAMIVLLALGGSTNGPIHLIAMAKRAGIPLELEDFNAIADAVPVLANIKPSGEYLMEDFFDAGGLPALMARIADRLDLNAQTVNGRTLKENLEGAENFNDDVIRPLDNPVSPRGGIVALKGSLAPDGCIIKVSAASERLLQHRGKAFVFEDREDAFARLNSDELDIDENSVLVLRNCGPVGRGLPEWGMLPIPDRLLKKGVRDMVRISDARMSGTHFGTVVLHISPESAVGGPLALVQDGDEIELDVKGRALTLHVSEEELEKRRNAWKPVHPEPEGYWRGLYAARVSQCDTGACVDCNFAERSC